MQDDKYKRNETRYSRSSNGCLLPILSGLLLVAGLLIVIL